MAIISKKLKKLNYTLEWASESVYSDEYYDIYLKYLMKYSFDIVHIHHLIFHTFDLPKLCKELNIPLILSIHDVFYLSGIYFAGW